MSKMSKNDFSESESNAQLMDRHAGDLGLSQLGNDEDKR
jgi:hypothetical protein